MKKVITFIILILSIIGLASCNRKVDNYDYNTNYNQEVNVDEVYHDDEENIDYSYYNARIQYASNKRKPLVPVVYSDEIFFKDSTVYHHFLAKQSIGLALASFNLDGDYDEEREYVGTLRDYLYGLGFDQLRIDDYYKETSEYTIGTAIGKKKIYKDGEESTLFVVAIRGGNYKNEWQSNLNVNEYIRHEGFDNAATLVTDRLLSYITTQEEVGDYKVWITGFSRAGAIANLVAANLNSSLLFDKTSVYAYTFAAPEVVWGYVDQDEYSNIFNIMNASDFIPQFVPMQWDYHHYGNNLYLPGAEFDSKFNVKYAKIQESLKEKNIVTNYNPNFNLRVRLLYGLFLELCPNEFVFSDEVQPLFLSILGDKSVNNVIQLFRNTFLEWKEKYPELIDVKNQILNYVLDFIPHLLFNDGFMSGYSNELSNPILQLAHEHFPELYFYQIYNIEEKELYNGCNEFAYIMIDNRVNYSIKDKKTNEVLYKIENGEKILTDYAKNNNYDISYFKVDDKNVLILPYDLDYELTYIAKNNTDIDVRIMPYGRIFTSNIKVYDVNKKVNENETGILLSIDNDSKYINGIGKDLVTHEVAAYFSIDRSVFNYQMTLISIVLAICLSIAIIIFLVYLLRSKIGGSKLSVLKFISVALVIISTIEAEMSYFLLSDYLFITVIFKSISILSIFFLCYLTFDFKKDIKKIHKTLVPFILIMAIGCIVISFNITVALGIYIVGFGYLIYYYLSKKMLPKNVWIIYGIVSIVVLGILMFFVRSFDVRAIMIYILSLLLLLTVLCASMHVGVKEYATYLLVVSFIFLMLYLYRDYHFIYSVLYSLMFNIGLALIIIEKIDVKEKKKDDNLLIINDDSKEEIKETNEVILEENGVVN